MENVLKLLEHHHQVLLYNHFKNFSIDNFDNLDINNLEYFLEKLNEIKNLKEDKGEECAINEPNLIDINSIYECNNPPNGSIFINMYKKECILNELKHLGLEIIKKNKVAVLFLAGGLGSRLGLNKAKGLLEVTPLLNKSYFQFFFEQIKFLELFCSSHDDKKEISKDSENEIKNCHSADYCMCEKMDKINCESDNNNSNNDKSNNNICVQDLSYINSLKLALSKDTREVFIHSPHNKKEKNGKVTIYIYIMTSNYTHDMTVEYLKKNKFFGLKKENIFIFKQRDNYSTDFNFNILLSKQNKLLTSPAGNGDIFRAIDENDVIQDMINKNIKYIQIASIDNILNKIADPILIGFCSYFNCDIANKSVKKKEGESMGVFCLKKKKKPNSKHNSFSICEYTELTEHILKNSKLFEYGNICHHIFSFDFLYYIVKNKKYNKMKLHKISRKKEYYDLCLKSNKDNPINETIVYCYEYFIFDVFKYATKILSFEVSRDKEFNPIKNNHKGDSIFETQKSLSNLHKTWLINKNFNLINNKDEKLNFCEISPLVSYDGSFFFHLPKRKNIYLPYILDHNSS